ncbi:MAG: glycosyltransferase [Proteobacteria bacterium]|nr:glycosyltransferase [Pseudomonadota bacterium]
MKKKKRNKSAVVAVKPSEKPLISVCMIAKNEEKFIDQCLSSVKPIADEIIFVDTGSTDQTVEIARKYTDKIYFHPWNDSFSEARNHYLKYAKGDWIFQIDADDELVQESIANVLMAVQDKEIDAILVQIVNTTRTGSVRDIQNVERIFRNNGVIHYEGRIHNRVVGITSAKVYPIRYTHHGYNLIGEDADKKFNRTVTLLKRDLDDNPEDPVTHHYLSCSYLSRNMYKETLEYGLKAINLAETRNHQDIMFLWTHYNVCLAYYRLNDPIRAEEIAQKALAKDPGHIDSHYMMIVICYDQKRWDDLIYHAEQYLRLLETVEINPAHFGTLILCSLNEAWNIHVLLGIARHDLGDPKFEESFEKAINVAPEPFLAARAAGIYFSNAGVSEHAIKYLELADKLHPGDETVHKCLKDLGKKMPTISCVMIVKNEEAFLDKCLLSVKDWVDEIIIVDTGSEDDTVKIARHFTDKIYFHPWEGSFSKARNQAMQYATGDWIFQIDGDEEMMESNGELLRDVVASAGNADAFLVTLISTYANGRKTARHNFERLFRNNGVIHYESIVHNQVVGQTCTKPSKIEIMHYGYSVDDKKANEKFIRTTELLKKQIAEDPDNPKPHHYLSASYMSHALFRDCIAEAEKAVELAEKIGDEHSLYLWSRHNAAMSYYYLGDMENARRHALRTLEKFDGHMDSYHVLTLVSAEQGDWNAVLQYGEKYLKRLAFYEAQSDKAGVLINMTMKEGAMVCLLTGYAWCKIGHKIRMMDCYRKAEVLADEPWQLWYNAAVYHMDKTHDYAESKTLLDKAIHLAPEEQSVWYSLAKLGFLSKDRLSELSWLMKLQQAGSKDESILNKLAMLLLEDGRTDEAAHILEVLLLEKPGNLQALLNIGIAYKRLNQCEKAVEKFMKVIELDPLSPKPWFHLSEISKVLGNPDESNIFMQRAQTLNESQSMQCLSLDAKANDVGNIDPVRKKIVFFARQSLDKFLDDVIKELSDEYETRKIIIPSEEQIPQLIDEGMQWADICWFEWCDELVIYGSNREKRSGQEIVCRLHSYEAFTDYPLRVNWPQVDMVIFIADHIREVVLEMVDALKKEQTTVIPNGIDAQKFTYKKRNLGYNIASVGYINYKKGPMLLLHAFKALYDTDRRYKLYLAGTFEDNRYVLYYRQMITELGLEKNIFFNGWQDNIDRWLEDKHYILCTSVLESQHLSVMQAMSKGIKPIIHNFVGAKTIYPKEYIWNTISDCVRLVLDEHYDSEAYRNFIAQHYSLASEISAIKQTLAHLA